MVRCPKCISELPEGARFCAKCGTPIVPQCPKCGADVSPDAAFCMKCGAAVEKRDATPVRHETSPQMETAATSVGIAVTQTLPAGEAVPPDVDQLSLFVGKNHEYYQKKWQKMGLNKPKHKTYSWNWAALLAGIWWYGYRKMYLMVGICGLVYLVLDLLGASMELNLVLNLLLALMGNGLYYAFAKAKVAKLVKSTEDSEQRRLAIMKAGGTSWLGVVVATIVILVAALPSLSGAASGSGNAGQVVFCERVDENLHPINEGSTFTTGQITVRLERGSRFGTNAIKMTIYKVDGDMEWIYDSSEREINPDWTILSVDAIMAETGNYKVQFAKLDGEILGSGEVVIAED